MSDGAPNATDLRLADLATFLSVVRSGSVSGAARGLSVTPSQVSKAVARLERQLGVKLLVRGRRGVSVSDAGKRLAPRFDEMLDRARSLVSPEAAAPRLTVAGTAALNAMFFPALVESLSEMRLRSIELPPGVASAYAGEGLFDLCLTTGVERWPATWVSARVGLLRKGLFASPRMARRLGPRAVSPERVREAMFIAPVYSHQGQAVPGDDGCPLPHGERRFGHETQTLALALEIARHTEQVVFAPVLAARPLVRQGLLTEVRVRGWDVHDTLSLWCDADRLGARVQQRVVAALRAVL